MAPLMVGAVISSAVVFTTVLIWQFEVLQQRFNAPPAASSITWTAQGREPSDYQEQLQLATVQASYQLERESIARRYDQANSTLEARLWTRLMGFLTGMILALVGAAFVLGKLETERSEVEAAATGLSFTVRSASPGIVMGVLGTALMAITIVVPATVTTRDGAIYFLPSAAPVALPPPPLAAIVSANPANQVGPHLKAAPGAQGGDGSPIARPRFEPKLKSQPGEEAAP